MSRNTVAVILVGLTLLAGCGTAPPITDEKTGMELPRRHGMVLIPAGEFMMGSPPGECNTDEHPRHLVHLDAFYMDEHEVTIGEYMRFVEATGHRPLPKWVSEYSPEEDYPVVGVSWNDAQAYATWAKKRLPTEAEWEYACRAGTTTKYNVGDLLTPDDANFIGIGGKDQWERTAPVGSFPPNDWGLYDMHGNVFEWCQDWYDEKYYEYSPRENPQGPADGLYRVLRGGSWISRSLFRGSASRLSGFPHDRGHNVGFRCVRDLR